MRTQTAQRHDPKYVALISGGTRGIGRGIALDLARQGWAVAVTYEHNEIGAEQLRRLLEELGTEHLVLRKDIVNSVDNQDVCDAVHKRWGRLNALINAVGPFRRVALQQETTDAWKEVFEKNVHGVFDLCQRAIKLMPENEYARIINFGIVHADKLAAQPHLTAYCAAKAALLVLTRSLAQVLGPREITVNMISPGFIETGSETTEYFREHMKDRIPAHRLGTIEEVLHAVRFLLSDESGYVSGANIAVSGAWGV